MAAEGLEPALPVSAAAPPDLSGHCPAALCLHRTSKSPASCTGPLNLYLTLNIPPDPTVFLELSPSHPFLPCTNSNIHHRAQKCLMA